MRESPRIRHKVGRSSSVQEENSRGRYPGKIVQDETHRFRTPDGCLGIVLTGYSAKE